jgi:hypothetical protein
MTEPVDTAQLTPEQRLIRRMWASIGNVFEHSLDRPRPTIEGMAHLPDDELAALVAALPSADEEARVLHEQEVADHVSEIMFESGERPNPECLLCQRGVEFGVWKRFGVDDPFAEEADDDR